ncbi:MAG: M28 family peptidase [Verrucomicrobiota bacterium]|nr:M28 family peptidase [Verrucomicrobiota bacterium]
MARRLGFLAVGWVLLGAVSWWFMIRMPGQSFPGRPPALTPDEVILRDELAADVQKLAGDIGERNAQHYPGLLAAADFIERSLAEAGLQPRRDGFELRGKRFENIEVEIGGTGEEIIVIGAHYDSVFGSPGANDNGSGVAALLALARRFAGPAHARRLRFVAFTNEEPAYFQTEEMGSLVYAKRCRARGDRIAGMISLETIGYFSNEAGSQKYPVPGLQMIYPGSGNFIGFIGNLRSSALLRKALGSFRAVATIPSEGAALPAKVPGVGWSDQWAFWQCGYPALMLTDTAPFRYPYYHTASDTPDKIDYASMARVVRGMERVIARLANDAD